jgi:hypothetical protein
MSHQLVRIRYTSAIAWIILTMALGAQKTLKLFLFFLIVLGIEGVIHLTKKDI